MDSKRKQQYVRVFNHLDTDGDGRISPSELQRGVELVGQGMELSPEEAQKVFEAMGKAGDDNTLALEDFIELVEGGEEEDRLDDLKAAFKMYQVPFDHKDVDDDDHKKGGSCSSTSKGAGAGGVITPKSLKRMLSRLGDKRTVRECQAMISAFDLNGDGHLDFEEFKAMMS